MVDLAAGLLAIDAAKPMTLHAASALTFGLFVDRVTRKSPALPAFSVRPVPTRGRVASDP